MMTIRSFISCATTAFKKDIEALSKLLQGSSKIIGTVKILSQIDRGGLGPALL